MDAGRQALHITAASGEIRQRGAENKKGVTITRNAFICCC
jgi:hypothetical protein